MIFFINNINKYYFDNFFINTKQFTCFMALFLFDQRKMLKNVDIFPKFSDQELRVKTNSAALLSVITFSMMLIMFLHEVYRYVKPRTFDEISVDTSNVGLMRAMSLSFNVTIALPCSKIHVNAFDYEGKQAGDRNQIHTQRIDENGVRIGSQSWLKIQEQEKKRKKKSNPEPVQNSTYCGSCYGAGEKVECCNCCDDIITKFLSKGWDPYPNLERWEQCIKEGFTSSNKESCNIYGDIRVSRTSGTLYFSVEDNARPGQKALHDLSRISPSNNLSHSIHYFEFGTKVPGSVHPLDGTNVLMKEKARIMYNYLIQVIPTKWISTTKFELNTYKFHPVLSVKNLTQRISREVPGIYFKYDIAPVSVISRQTRYSLWRLMTSICAIVGGAFTCANLADQFFFRTLATLEGKRSIGKDI